MTTSNLTYTDHNNTVITVKNCRVTVDKLDRHWIWSEQLKNAISYGEKGRENALIAAINSLLFTISLRDERIAKLQRIADLADGFVDKVNAEYAPTED